MILTALLCCVRTGFAAPPSLTFSVPQPVGTASAPVTVTVTAQNAGTVANVEILTLGTAGLDFSAGGGASSCAAASLAALQTCTQSVVFTPASPGIRLGAVVLLDSSSNVLGTAYLSGKGLGGLGVLVPGNVISAAGSGEWDLLEDGESATSADLNLPASVALDGAGNIYIADSIHNRVRKVDASTRLISTFAGNGNTGLGADGVPAAASALNTPSGVAVDGAGNVYIADTGNNLVREVLASTGLIYTVAGSAAATALGDGGPATSATLNQPWGVTVDFSGNLYIADTFDNRVRCVDAVTRIITTVAGTGFTNPNGTGAYSGDGGPATLADLNHPFAVAFDFAGNMYIPDASNNRVRVVNSSGTISTFAGNGTAGYLGDGAVATAAELWYPAGVIVDAAQNVYISDSQNAAIRKVNAATKFIQTIVPAGKSLEDADTLYTPTLYGPMGLALDGKGNLYVADYYNMRIREVESNVAVLDFTAHPTRQGDTSAPLTQTIENDGNDILTLTSVTAQTNATVAAGTTCPLPILMGVNSSCAVNAEFSPTSAGNPLIGDIDVAGQTVNGPLQIKLAGDATAVNSTDTALLSSPNPSTFGQVVTLRATVTTGSGTGALTGTVNFIDTTTGTTLKAGVPVNSSGVASFTTPSLSVGLHAITAAYSGDAGHFASTSSILNQAVDEATATTITSSGSPAALGSSVTFTAAVAISGGGGIPPSGNVTFNDGPNVLATVALGPGLTASWSTTALGDGVHSITAVYLGSAPYYINGSTSPVLNQDVQAPSSVALSSSPNPSSYGAPVTFTAAVSSSGSVPPIGTVKFLDGTSQIGTGTIVGTTGVATFTTSALVSGSHSITAAYEGSQNDGPATSAPLTQTVNKTVTTTALAGTPNPGIAGKSVTLIATVKNTAGGATTNGTVTFVDGTTTLGAAPLSAGGTATISPLLAPGSHAIVASYGGDANDDVSSSAVLALPVILATTSVTLSSSSSPATVLASITFTAAVAGNGGVPTGSLTFSVDGKPANTAALDSTGKATFSDSSLAVGNHTIVAAYAGDTDDNPSTSASFTQAVQPIATVTSLGTGTTAGTNPQTVLIASVLGASGPTPSGTVTFSNGSSVLGTAPLDSNGVATLLPDLAPSAYNIVASYGGDSLHAASASAALKITGTPVGFGITVNPATLTLQTTQNTTVTVAISSSNGYADTIGLGCGTLPAAVTCHFVSNTVSLKAGSSASVQLTIDTNNPLGGGSRAMNSSPGSGGFSLAALFLPAGLLFGWTGWRFRRRNAVFFAATLGLLLSAALFTTGCGATFSQSSAKPGTYTIEVTGVGSNSNITHYQTITLTITK